LILFFLEFEMSFSKSILVTGNVVDGFKHVGPFASNLEACHFAEVNPIDKDWIVADLDAPVNQDEEMTSDEWSKVLKMTVIGEINEGHDGNDIYVLVNRTDGEYLPVQVAQQFVLGHYYRRCAGPGQIFCDFVMGFKGLMPSTCVCVAQIRYDI